MIVTFTMTDADGTVLIEDICVATSYDAASGKTKGQWAKEKMIAGIKSLAVRGAVKTAATNAQNAISAIVIS